MTIFRGIQKRWIQLFLQTFRSGALTELEVTCAIYEFPSGEFSEYCLAETRHKLHVVKTVKLP